MRYPTVLSGGTVFDIPSNGVVTSACTPVTDTGTSDDSNTGEAPPPPAARPGHIGYAGPPLTGTTTPESYAAAMARYATDHLAAIAAASRP